MSHHLSRFTSEADNMPRRSSVSVSIEGVPPCTLADLGGSGCVQVCGRYRRARFLYPQFHPTTAQGIPSFIVLTERRRTARGSTGTFSIDKAV